MKKLILGLAAASLCTLAPLSYLSTPAFAGPYEDGVKAYNAKNYTQALKLLQPLAEQGNATAQAFIGGMYLSGQGVTENKVQAVHWMRKAAEQNLSIAQYLLGLYYYEGKVGTQNYLYAAKWYKKAAEQGDVDAQYELGLMYKKGEGVKKDMSKAAYWFEKAKEQNHTMALAHYSDILTNALISGVILDEDPYRTPPPRATFEQGIQALKTKDFGKAFKILEPLANEGNVTAQSLTGTMYANGMGRPVNQEMAIYWWAKSATQDNAQAQFNLGVAYAKGAGVPQSKIEAINWFKKAEANNHPQAKAALKQLGVQ